MSDERTVAPAQAAPAGGRPRTRLAYLDLLRVLAIVLVVFNHLPGYELYQTGTGAAEAGYLALSLFARVNVPLFFMVSGALLLGRDEPVGRVLSHRAARIALVILLISGAYYALDPTGGGTEPNGIPASGPAFLSALLAGNVHYSYWFLYAYLGMLLMLPYLRRVARGFCLKDALYFVALHALLWTVVPPLDYAASVAWDTEIWVRLTIPLMTEHSIFYLFLGYYLGRVLDVRRVTGRHVALLAAAAIAGAALSGALTYRQGTREGFTQDFMQMTDYISAIALFVAARWAFEGAPGLGLRLPRLAAAASGLGQLVFGVYLFDPFLRLFWWDGFEAALLPALPELWVSLLWCLTSLAVGAALTAALRRVPLVGKLL